MSNQQYIEIVTQKVTTFLSRFDATRRIYGDALNNDECYHNGEFGRSREDACSSLLKDTICSAFGVSRGFVLNCNDQRTTECDIVIHNPLYHPLHDPSTGTDFFAAESVVAIGEIKSVLTRTKLKSALGKLSENKKIRNSLNGLSARDVRSFQAVNINTEVHHTLAPFTFLVCEKIDRFDDGIAHELGKYYDDAAIPGYLRHNLILSIRDGLLTYDGSELSQIIGEQVRVFPYPKLMKEKAPPVPITIRGEPVQNVLAFLINLSNSLENAHCFYPEPTKYL